MGSTPTMVSLDEIAARPSEEHPIIEDECHAPETALRVHNGKHWLDCQQVLSQLLDFLATLSECDRVIVFCRLRGHELGSFEDWMRLLPNYDIWGVRFDGGKGIVTPREIRRHFSGLFAGWTPKDITRRQQELKGELREFCLRIMTA